MPQVSWSEVRIYRRCPKAHEYKYHQRLRRKRRNIPMLKGSILHEMLNAFTKAKMMKDYQGPDPWAVLAEYDKTYRDLFLEEQEKYGDVIGDCSAIFEGYVRHHRQDGLKYEASEEFVATDLITDVRFIGYIDRIAVDKEGRRWIMDSKFMRRIPGADERFPELQMVFYFWAWNRSHEDRKADGIMWDYARAKAPTRPELLKNGELSQRKNIDTDARTYLETIGQHGLDPKNYAEMLAMLQGKENTFFERVRLPSPPKELVNLVVEDFRATTTMIQKLKGVAPRHMSQFNCQGCEFKQVCEAEVRGLDAEFVKKTQYELKPEFGDKEHGGTEDQETDE